MKLELIMLLYGLLRKILSRVVYKKDICTPHMHNVVQNYEKTINRGTSRLFSAMKNSSIRLFLTLSKLPTSPNYPDLNVKRIS